MNITLVTKVKLDGNYCRKSAEVLSQLKQSDLLSKIDNFVEADARNLSSEGYLLAHQYQISSAPFFILKTEDSTCIYTSYKLFLDNVFHQSLPDRESISDAV